MALHFNHMVTNPWPSLPLVECCIAEHWSLYTLNCVLLHSLHLGKWL